MRDDRFRDSCRRANDRDRSEGLAAGQGVGEHVAVGEFERAAGGQAASEPSDPDSRAAEPLCDEQGRPIAFEIGVGGHDEFDDGVRRHPGRQRIDSQLFGSHAR